MHKTLKTSKMTIKANEFHKLKTRQNVKKSYSYYNHKRS